MMPLILKIKKKRHKEVAEAQDIIVEELYNFFENAVLHGGTAIWRCYQGNRFSEDIDAYLPRNTEKINEFFKSLKKKGFEIKKKKIKENSLYSALQINRTTVRFEALFKKSNRTLKEYQTCQGTLVTVYTLTPEQLIKEKANAYLKRRKIRDLYDVFYLLRYAENQKEIRKTLKQLIKKYEPPTDQEQLKTLILTGITPDTQKMLEYIKRRA